MALSVFFLSYNEKNANENFKRLKEIVPYARRVHGVQGIVNAHKECARLSLTKYFYVVDADNWVYNTFDFSWKPDKTQLECVHNWHSYNPVNGLVYGYGGIKLFPKKRVLEIPENTVDVTTSLNGFIEHQQVSSITYFNVDEFSSWKAGFRESAKLAMKDDEISKERLRVWQTVNIGDYGYYACKGAIEGENFVKNNPECYSLINDFEYLEKLWENYNE